MFLSVHTIPKSPKSTRRSLELTKTLSKVEEYKRNLPKSVAFLYTNYRAIKKETGVYVCGGVRNHFHNSFESYKTPRSTPDQGDGRALQCKLGDAKERVLIRHYRMGKSLIFIQYNLH